MVHPATTRAALTAVRALGVPVDLGLVFPGTDGSRGTGRWTGKDLNRPDIARLLPRAAAANAQGAAIYIRLGPGCRTRHPGIVLLDDLDNQALAGLDGQGFAPCLVVETSPGNFQAWVRLLRIGSIPYELAHAASRALAARFDGDPRAVSPLQPGRLPGFTNRKEKYAAADGRYPFVRMISANRDSVAAAGSSFLDELANSAQCRGAARVAPETLPTAAQSLATGSELSGRLHAIWRAEEQRILDEVSRGTRPTASASQSEIDYAASRAARAQGISSAAIVLWLANMRPQKGSGYALRTVRAARELPTPRGPK
jgi:hypothetical protein